MVLCVGVHNLVMSPIHKNGSTLLTTKADA